MKKIILILTMLLMITGCGSLKNPEKIELENGNVSYTYYNEDGNIKKYEVYDGEELIEEHIHSYDEDGNEQYWLISYYKNGIKILKENYRNNVKRYSEYYDENGEKIRTDTYDENGELEQWYEPLDEELGEGYVYYRPDNSIELVQVFTEDEDRNFVSTETYYDENGEITKIFRTTTKKNSVKEEILYERD